MGYYGRPSLNRGDYYRGDYYRGDPNIFGSIGRFFGGVAKAAIGIAAPVLGGLIKVAGPGEKFSTPFSAGSGPNVGPPMTPGGIAALNGGGVGVMAPGGGRGIITQSPLGTPVSQAAIEMQIRRQRRMHPNHSTYITRGGGTSRWPGQLIVHPKGTELVPARRMNVANPRALRRGIRRIRGFVKLARKAVRAVGLTIAKSGSRGRKAVARRR